MQPAFLLFHDLPVANTRFLDNHPVEAYIFSVDRRFLNYFRQQGGIDDFSAQGHRNGLDGRMNAKVLILNQNYEPMSVINVRKAIVLLYLGKAELVEAYDGKLVHSVSVAMPFPSILRLSMYVRVPYKKIILSRKNILRRDGHRCQFCGRGTFR